MILGITIKYLLRELDRYPLPEETIEIEEYSDLWKILNDIWKADAQSNGNETQDEEPTKRTE